MISSAYRSELDKVMLLAKQAIAADIDIEMLRSELSKLDTLAPIFAPSEWMRGGADNLDQQRKLIEGVAPFLRAIRELKAVANSRLQALMDRAVREAEETNNG